VVIGVTGHRQLEDAAAWLWVEEALRTALAEAPRPLIGISSLATGADQLFATLLLEQGGELRVLVPFPTYEETFAPGSDRERYRELLARAASVETLPARDTAEESYLAAGQRIADLSDRMIAVWDGKKAAGLGGTGDIVQYARNVGKDVLHINPIRREVVPVPTADR
jgi:hypothetical protein